MCRGLALGFTYNADGMPEVIFEGIASHTDTLRDQEDEYLKFEIIIDDSKRNNYAIELDESYYYGGKLDAEVYRTFRDCFTTRKTVKHQVIEDVRQWVKDHEVDVLRTLLVNTHYARFSNGQYISYCEAGKNQNMYFCKAGKNQDFRHCEAGKNQYFNNCKAGGEQYIAFMHSGNKGNNAFMDELSTKNPRLTLNMLLEMARFAPEDEVQKILSNNK